MSVLIKGLEMPTSCLSCPLQGGTADCRLTQKTYNWGLTDRPSDCPLVPVPPHGRLIDADWVRNDIDKKRPGRSYKDAWALTIIDAAPTIIPAEEGET